MRKEMSMGEIPEGRKPLTWADIDFGDRPRGHPSTERLEIEKLQEEICRQKEYKEDYKAAYIEVSEEHERLRAENERLRAAHLAIVETTEGLPGTVIQECRQIARAAIGDDQ